MLKYTRIYWRYTHAHMLPPPLSLPLPLSHSHTRIPAHLHSKYKPYTPHTPLDPSVLIIKSSQDTPHSPTPSPPSRITWGQQLPSCPRLSRWKESSPCCLSCQIIPPSSRPRPCALSSQGCIGGDRFLSHVLRGLRLQPDPLLDDSSGRRHNGHGGCLGGGRRRETHTQHATCARCTATTHMHTNTDTPTPHAHTHSSPNHPAQSGAMGPRASIQPHRLNSVRHSNIHHDINVRNAKRSRSDHQAVGSRM